MSSRERSERFEQLETRRLLVATASWNDQIGSLSVYGDDEMNFIAITSYEDNGKTWVSISGVDGGFDGQNVGCEAGEVKTIFVDAKGGADHINLNGVNSSNGYSAADLNAKIGNIMILGSDGEDSLFGSEFNDGFFGYRPTGAEDYRNFIDGGDGDDSMTGSAKADILWAATERTFCLESMATMNYTAEAIATSFLVDRTMTHYMAAGDVTHCTDRVGSTLFMESTVMTFSKTRLVATR